MSFYFLVINYGILLDQIQLEVRFFEKKELFLVRKMLKRVFNEYYDGKLEDRYNVEVDKYLDDKKSNLLFQNLFFHTNQP